MKDLFLTSATRITRQGMYKDGQLLAGAAKETDDLLRDIYQKLDISYPKFFKMDNLSKLGILGTEPFFSDGKLKQRYSDDEIAVVLANRSSSMESDRAHYNNYSNATASPAVFVYTLPNIVIGEICIRHQLFSESNFYIFEEFDAGELLLQARVLLSETACKACILGWVESYEENFEAVFYLLETEGKTEASETVLKQAYH